MLLSLQSLRSTEPTPANRGCSRQESNYLCPAILPTIQSLYSPLSTNFSTNESIHMILMYLHTRYRRIHTHTVCESGCTVAMVIVEMKECINTVICALQLKSVVTLSAGAVLWCKDSPMWPREHLYLVLTVTLTPIVTLTLALCHRPYCLVCHRRQLSVCLSLASSSSSVHGVVWPTGASCPRSLARLKQPTGF